MLDQDHARVHTRSTAEMAMTREDATVALRALVGRDLHALADDYGITVRKHGRLNKGWAGSVVERHLGLPANTRRTPDFDGFELKVIPLKHDRHGRLVVKESMAITMFTADEVLSRPFEQSHLRSKMERMIVVARLDDAPHGRSEVCGVASVDLDADLFPLVKADYRLVQDTVRVYGFDALSGRMKGAGHGSTSRAFYARARLLSWILGLEVRGRR
jgi:hypothetical protein